ncbi:MAG: ABC transporter permease [Candidatus Eiseniibacteriota bacterium]|nr:MAG: ABC transporter permease [Candidatus Eisenbacteria bacterium]
MFKETLILAFGNVRRAKLRYTLTMCGIMIGTGAIVSMISYAVGMQSEISDTISSSGLLTTVYVLPRSSPMARMAPGGDDENALASDSAEVHITDAVLEKLSSIEEVRSVFPVLAFPAIVSLGAKKEFALVAGLPLSANEVLADRLDKGEVFSSETDSLLLASASLARRLEIDPDSLGPGIPVTITIVTLQKDVASSIFSFGTRAPLATKEFRFRLGGVLKEAFVSPHGRTDAYIPFEMTKVLAAQAVRDPGDILKNLSRQGGGYPGAEVHVSSMAHIGRVSEEIRSMGLLAMSVSDQLKRVRSTFVLLSAFLGAIGGAALLVGCLGIMNVMLMSVLERTREIGIMKSTGATRRNILGLFVTEAALVGVVGGLLGIVLGWVVAEATNHIMFAFVVRDEIPFRRLYEIPAWLMAGAVVLAIGVSIAAGLYPARRAARMDPAVALRYE